MRLGRSRGVSWVGPHPNGYVQWLPTSLLVLSLQKGKKEGSTSTVQATKATHV
ncbi:hypothetical protein YC2023_049679 [Brassica napus]